MVKKRSGVEGWSRWRVDLPLPHSLASRPSHPGTWCTWAHTWWGLDAQCHKWLWLWEWQLGLGNQGSHYLLLPTGTKPQTHTDTDTHTHTHIHTYRYRTKQGYYCTRDTRLHSNSNLLCLGFTIQCCEKNSALWESQWSFKHLISHCFTFTAIYCKLQRILGK